MPQQSAGILMYRRAGGTIEVLLVHPGGPFFAKKDDGAWTIPKGLCAPGEDALAAARREFREETGMAPAGEFTPLGEFRQSSAKTVTALRSRAVSTGGSLRAKRSRSNGRRAPAARRSSRKWTAPAGFRSPKRGGKS